MKLTRVFAPGQNSPTADFGLLMLRVWLGVAIFLNHGWSKLTQFHEMAPHFFDPLHVGSPVSLVAFVLVHKMKLTGGFNGELAFIYLAGFVALLIAGPGRYSADSFLFGKSAK